MQRKKYFFEHEMRQDFFPETDPFLEPSPFDAPNPFVGVGKRKNSLGV